MTQNKTSYWLKSGKFALLERVAMLIFGLGNFYFLVRILDKESYGTWMLFISIATLIEVSRNGFFKNPLIRIMGLAHENEKNDVQSASLILHFFSSLLLAVLLYGISFPLGDLWGINDFDKLFFLFLIANFALPFFFHFEYILVANLDFKGSFLGQLIRNGIIFFVLSIFFTFSVSLNLESLAIIYTFSVFAGAVSNAWFSSKYIALSFTWRPALALKLFHYGKYTFGTSIAAVLLRNIDAWMLAWFISPVAVATYNVAIRISNLVEVPIMALSNIMFPKAVQGAAIDGDSIFKGMYEKSVAAILLFSIPIVFFVIIFSSFIIQIIAGEEYKESSFILQITIFYSFVLPFNKQMGILLDAIGRAKINMMFVILAALLNTLFNYLLIPALGVTGAAFATLSTFIIVVVFNLIYLHKKYSVSLIQVMKYCGIFLVQFRDKMLIFLSSIKS